MPREELRVAEGNIARQERPGTGGNLAEWVAAGLITQEQADAIAAFEASKAKPRRIPLVTEALGYLGAILALVAGAVVLGKSWEKLAISGRLAVPAAVTVLLLFGGWWIRGAEEPALERLGSVLWVGSVAAFGWFLVILSADALDLSDETSTFVAGSGAALLGLILWMWRMRILQEAALFGGLCAALGGGLAALPGHFPGWLLGLAIWALGLTWAVLGWRGLVRPTRTAYALGALAALVGPQMFETAHGWGVLLGLATAAGLMAASVALHEIVLLGLGAVGLFRFVMEGVVRYFGKTLGVPLALFLAGLVLLGIALVTARLRRLTAGPRAAPPPGVAT